MNKRLITIEEVANIYSVSLLLSDAGFGAEN